MSADLDDLAAKLAAAGAAPEETGRRPAFPLTRLGDIALRPVEWLARGFVPAGGVVAIFGEPGSFKSFVLTLLAVAVASGKDFLGQPTRQGLVIILLGEGRRGFVLRLYAAAREMGVDPTTLPIFVSEVGARLGDPAFTTEAREAIEAVRAEAGEPVMLAVDTLASQLVGDENVAMDMTAALRQLETLAPTASRLLVHHSPHGELRLRGSTALRGAIDAGFACAKAKNGTMTLSCAKMKDGPEPRPMALRLKTIELDDLVDDDGLPVKSGVLAPADGADVAEEVTEPRGRNLQLGLAVLRRLHAECAANLERAGRDPSTARPGLTQWREALAAEGIDRRRFGEIRDGLLRGGFISIDGVHVLPVAAAPSECPPKGALKGPPIRTDISDTRSPVRPAPIRTDSDNSDAPTWESLGLAGQV